ncbi:MAG: transcriptional repressor [Candidatus Moraniibacteriota bacterium]|nr:MAG: transcriptional repressor [Candidatus Moranbacteria bacterium]
MLSVLVSASKPVSVFEILDILSRKKRVFNKTTLYREMEVLKKEGYVKEVFFRNDTALYELVGEHHHHLVCTSCGDVRDVHLEESLECEERKLERREHFIILDHSLEFFGKCKECQ